ncbi:MAG: hypothetical protein K2M93_08085 [Muribaculaceae bacterium]|nr:hypothetical protein [Muribaculaceae bacterium]
MEKEKKKINILNLKEYFNKSIRFERIMLDKDGEIMLNVIYDDRKNFKIFLDCGLELQK